MNILFYTDLHLNIRPTLSAEKPAVAGIGEL
jgi:hypothetical protein